METSIVHVNGEKMIFESAKLHSNAFSTSSESFNNIHCTVPNIYERKYYITKSGTLSMVALYPAAERPW